MDFEIDEISTQKSNKNCNLKHNFFYFANNNIFSV